jgi:hypothetical protein
MHESYLDHAGRSLSTALPLVRSLTQAESMQCLTRLNVVHVTYM